MSKIGIVVLSVLVVLSFLAVITWPIWRPERIEIETSRPGYAIIWPACLVWPSLSDTLVFETQIYEGADLIRSGEVRVDRMIVNTTESPVLVHDANITESVDWSPGNLTVFIRFGHPICIHFPSHNVWIYPYSGPAEYEVYIAFTNGQQFLVRTTLIAGVPDIIILHRILG